MRTSKERADEIDRQIEQLKARKKQILQKGKVDERKARTHRLIQIGAIVEAAFGCEIDPKVLQAYLTQHLVRKDGSTDQKSVGERQYGYYRETFDRMSKESSERKSEVEKDEQVKDEIPADGTDSWNQNSDFLDLI